MGVHVRPILVLPVLAKADAGFTCAGTRNPPILTSKMKKTTTTTKSIPRRGSRTIKTMGGKGRTLSSPISMMI